MTVNRASAISVKPELLPVLAEFRHNRTVQSPYENYFNLSLISVLSPIAIAIFRQRIISQ